MFRIDTPNKHVDLFGAGKHGFRDGDKSLGINPTELSAAQQNALQEEILGVIEAAGIVPNKADNAQLVGAIQRLIDAQSGNYALDTGLANAYVVALDPAVAVYGDGMTVRFKVINANTGASTLNAGGGVVPLVNDVGGALAAGDLPAGSVLEATYIASEGKFYITSMVQSQGDARYAQLGMLNGTNVIVNGDCSVSQVNGGSLITPVNGGYSIDNVRWVLSVAGKLQAQQVTNVLNSLGATHAETASVLSSYAPAASDSFFKLFPIEGVNFARFQYGTVNAKAGSLQFKARASVSGTYSGAIQSYNQGRSYPFSFTLVANTDTLVTIPNIPGDTGGVWVGANNVGAAHVVFDLGSGPNLKNASGAWLAGNYVGTTGSDVFVSKANASTLTITDVGFEVGPYCTEFPRKLYEQNLRECQRYYEQTWDVGTLPAGGNYPGLIRANSPVSDPSSIAGFTFSVPKRTTPTLVFYNPVTGVAGQVYRENDASTIAVTGYQYCGIRGLGSVQIALALNMSYLYHCSVSSRI